MAVAEGVIGECRRKVPHDAEMVMTFKTHVVPPQTKKAKIHITIV